MLQLEAKTVHDLFLTMRSVRGDAGSDVQKIFYEKVTALTGDQPPVVMVMPCMLNYLCMWMHTVCRFPTSISWFLFLPPPPESQRPLFCPHQTGRTLLGCYDYYSWLLPLHCPWVSQQVCFCFLHYKSTAQPIESSDHYKHPYFHLVFDNLFAECIACTSHYSNKMLYF